MGEVKYASVPPADARKDTLEMAVLATAVLDDSGPTASPPLATATKVDKFSIDDGGITVTWERGEVQPSAFRDKWFAISFVAQLLVVLGAGMAFGPAWRNNVTTTADVAETEEYSVDHVKDDDGGNLYETPSSEDGIYAQEAPPMEFWFAVILIALMSAPALSFVALTVMSR